jgi:hypothetical protein
MRDFAKRLIAHESRTDKSSSTTAPKAFTVIDKLRPTLVNLMGSAGFWALISRALALASPQVQWLQKLQIESDGSLQGLDELAGQLGADDFLEGPVILLAELLGLLVAFIGEKLTLQLVREIWPALPVGDLKFSKES